MKLFLRHAIPGILFFTGQMLILYAVLWLYDLYRPAAFFYIVLLNSIGLLIYLSYRFFSMLPLLRRMQQPVQSVAEPIRSDSEEPISVAVEQFLERQQTLFRNSLFAERRKEKERHRYVDQWIHQMKTPLSVIELILEHPGEHYQADLRQEVDRLRSGLDQMLYSSRLEAIETDLKAERLALKPLVTSIINQEKRLFVKNQVFPKLDIAEDVYVYTDAKWFRFLVLQLVTNAIKYTTGHGREVALTAEVTKGQVVLSVQDDGVGIPRRDVPRVFNAFFTGENGRRYGESTGMGLYFVQQVCLKLGHEIELESEEGVGTTCRIRLVGGRAHD
ncbi:sensor histidine kinase [Exiguobacterium sp. TBG-PICH-001]|uniref:sensor histidine kinase n=1 Tax=Exiguobacterium abrahamii TaxID=2785532 RepID=UPI0018A73826|nr:sensor histidine kinase [Exiguobacterium sp. TBG-PICH-001]MBF8151938.1 sensor histidine kinase [Exiguobacterium sp. TBG-PICH-001]